jgi:hypothetical protein
VIIIFTIFVKFKAFLANEALFSFSPFLIRSYYKTVTIIIVYLAKLLTAMIIIAKQNVLNIVIFACSIII